MSNQAVFDLADRLTLGAIRLTRTLRGIRPSSGGITWPEISALAVLVHAGRIAARDLAAGRVLTEADIEFRIPVESKITTNALQPYWLDHFVGKSLKVPVKTDEIIGFAEIGEGRA